MNWLDVRILTTRRSSAHTHKAQKYHAETMHELGLSFFKYSSTTKFSLGLRSHAVNAKSAPRHANINLVAGKQPMVRQNERCNFYISAQRTAGHPSSL
jgi:hypothetical protein